MQRIVLEALCEWEFRVKLKEKLEDGWDVEPDSVKMIPLANGHIHTFTCVMVKPDPEYNHGQL